MLNAIGLANIGIDAAINNLAPKWRCLETPVIVSISGTSVDEYGELAGRLEGTAGVAGIEVNISCPNVVEGGAIFGADPELSGEVTARVRAATSLPLIVKLTPNARDVVAVARSVSDAGAEAITVANTYLGLAINARIYRPSLANVTGGLSGPAIKPLTLRLVYDLAESIQIPIIGCGGIMSGEDAAEYMIAGASAVQVGTANLVDPFATPRIARELSNWCGQHGVHDPKAVIGLAHGNS